MLRKVFISLMLIYGSFSYANNDLLNLKIGGGGAFTFLKPDVRVGDIPFEQDLVIAKEYFWAEFEHFIPILPNIRIDYSSLKSDGKAINAGIIKSSFFGSINKTNIKVGDKSELDASTFDITFYWSIKYLFSSWFEAVDAFDIGLGIKDTSASSRLSIYGDSISPVEYDLIGGTLFLHGLYQYLKIHITPESLPDFGFEFMLKVANSKVEDNNGKEIGKSSMTDLTLKVDYIINSYADFDLGVEAGYRQLNMSNNYNFFGEPMSNVSIDVKTLFFGAFVNFGI